MRASLPRPSTSCAGTIESAARDASASSISDQCGSAGSSPVAARAFGRRASPTSRRPSRCRACRCRRPAARRGSPAGADCRGPPPKPNSSTDHARQPEREPQPLDRRRDHAEVLRDQRQRAELALRGVEDRRARPAPPAARRARCARAPAPTSRRRSRGSGRCARGRRAATHAAGARSTSGSRSRRSAGQS